MTKTTEESSWLDKLSDFLLGEPKDKKQLKKILRDAEQRSLFNKDALFMLEGVLGVSELNVRSVMIKRHDMVSININDDNKHILQVLLDSKHSRIPCFNDSAEEIIGILHAKDILPYLTGKVKELDIPSVLRPATFVPDNKKLDILLKEFRNSRNHMAIVLDEYGSVIGLATIEDVIEQIVGDIFDEFENPTSID